ncbi:MAG TPA: energy transducer TonB [Rhodanobacter sp.]|jgi:protein TonB|nr:energy transducer TonB [Rhodanobacter sp.]
MDTRYGIDSRAGARGRANTTLIAVIVLVVLFAVGAWLLIIRPHQEGLLADGTGHPAQSTSAAQAAAAAPPANVAAMGGDELLAEGRKALNERRYLAPAGNNAFEFYLRVLETQPGNRVATDALRETFPFAASSAEQAINSRDFNDAQRQIDLLAKADPTNYTLTILRSKLDAQRKMLDKQQQQELEQQKSQLAATQKAALAKQAADRLAEQQAQQAAAQQRAAPPPVAPAPQKQAPVAAPVATVAANAASGAGGATRDAVLTRAVAPAYPAVALRSRQSGWVVVDFTVDPEGRTRDITVVSAQPRRVFDNAAIDAVRRYRFTPAMSNGVAVATKRQQKIEFNL